MKLSPKKANQCYGMMRGIFVNEFVNYCGLSIVCPT